MKSLGKEKIKEEKNERCIASEKKSNEIERKQLGTFSLFGTLSR